MSVYLYTPKGIQRKKDTIGFFYETIIQALQSPKTSDAARQQLSLRVLSSGNVGQ